MLLNTKTFQLGAKSQRKSRDIWTTQKGKKEGAQEEAEKKKKLRVTA